METKFFISKLFLKNLPNFFIKKEQNEINDIKIISSFCNSSETKKVIYIMNYLFFLKDLLFKKI